MKRIAFILFFVMASLSSFAQDGVLKIKVLYAGGDSIFPKTKVTLLDVHQAALDSAVVDENGKVTFKPLVAGEYVALVEAEGYITKMKTALPVSAEKTTYVKVLLNKRPSFDDFTWKEIVIPEIEFEVHKIPLIEPTPITIKRFGGDEIRQRVESDINSIIVTVPAVKETSDGGISIRGSRSGDLLYYIDDVKIMGDANIPRLAIEELAVITGGIPAKYGDTTGGVVLITTRSPKSSY